MDEFGGNSRGGQPVAVWFDNYMIVAITGGGYPATEVMPAIANSIRADKPLPAMSRTVSENAWEFPRNASRIDGLSLTFAA